jgi:hypothetical protein
MNNGQVVYPKIVPHSQYKELRYGVNSCRGRQARQRLSPGSIHSDELIAVEKVVSIEHKQDRAKVTWALHLFNFLKLSSSVIGLEDGEFACYSLIHWLFP